MNLLPAALFEHSVTPVQPMARPRFRFTAWADFVDCLIEAALLGTFMVAACAATVLLEHPDFPFHHWIPQAGHRRALIGAAMGLTAVGLIYSRGGQRSGAHFNPAVTLTFYRLGRIGGGKAIGYAVAQSAGAIVGVELAQAIFGLRLAHPAVAFVVTVPGAAGTAVAFAAELLISFLLMESVLRLSVGRARYLTGWCCGLLVALYITFEAPLSGMSMNPARTLGSAVVADLWTACWIYFVAPPLGMLLAAELHLRRHHGGGLQEESSHVV